MARTRSATGEGLLGSELAVTRHPAALARVHPLPQGEREETARLHGSHRLVCPLQHAQRLQIGIQDRLLLGALVGVLLAHADDGAQRLDVVAVALGFAVDVLDVVGNRLLFLFKPLDALDDGLELVLGEGMRRLIVQHGRC